jgi:hypothetical protein
MVGAPKCATSALYQYLKRHPDIFMSDPKELNFFSTDITSNSVIKDEEHYLSLFTEAKGYKLIGEASVWYMYSKVAAHNIHTMSPDAKIIAMVRNPVDMIYSYYGQRRFNGTEQIQNFAEAIKAIPSRKNGKLLPNNPHPIKGLYYLDIARYTDQITRYIDLFGKENVRVIVFDDFKADSRKVYSETLEFLGLDSEIKHELPDNEKVRNASKNYKNIYIQRLLSNPPKSIIKIGKFLIPTDSLRQNIWEKLRVLNVEWKPKPELDPELRNYLQKEYQPEVEKLSALLERDLASLWNKA